MANNSEKEVNPQLKVTMSITYGPGSPAQKKAWRLFWAKVITGIDKSKVKDEENTT